MTRCLTITTIILMTVGCVNKPADKLILSKEINNQNCDCAKDTLLTRIISCEPKFLDNGKKIYWNYNCDSSWITFESKTGKKKTIFKLTDGLIQLTSRLGHTTFKEFKTTFLYTNKVISGCCDPDDYYLYDKNSGKLLKKFGSAIYVADNKKTPFVVNIVSAKENHIPNINFYYLSLYNIDTHKAFKINIQRGEIEKGMTNNSYMFPEDIFDTSIVNDQILTIKYFTDKYTKGNKLVYKTIQIDLKKYSS